jgi:2-polyprenyl-3-methyl-5-hydroxy-6-metoxy-1,4-benzoquinol methylase
VAVTKQQDDANTLNEGDQGIERFDPAAMHGSLLEAEHLARYWWASRFVADKRVLDAGCGTAYGTEILAGAGASEVVGVDIDPGVVEAARQRGGVDVSFEVADARELPFANEAFDMVVCFEVIEHVEDPESILDELRRVLGADGLLAVSSPNRDVYPPGNPHHMHEFVPEELAHALESRFKRVRLVRQHDWLGSGVLEDDVFASEEEPAEAVVRKAVSKAPGEELYTLALAADAELPSTKPYIVLTSTADVKWWQERLAELGQLRRAHEALTRRLIIERTERADLDARIAETQAENLDLEARLAQAEADNGELNAAIRSMQSTRVWRVGSSYWKLRDGLLRRR